MNSSRHAFQFDVDVDVRKLVTVEQVGRGLDVTVRFSSDIAHEGITTHLDGVIDPELRTDEHGVVIAWKSPLVRGVDWLRRPKKRRF